ncbi:hypothetical protein CEXT_168861, partial [Caerostris extrusa]
PLPIDQDYSARDDIMKARPIERRRNLASCLKLVAEMCARY